MIGLRFAIVFLLALATLSRNSLAEDAINQADVDSLVQPLIENNDVVALVIGIVRNGNHQVFTYGSLVPNGTERPHSKTIFEIGSITKTFTGLLLAQLVEEGTVQLDDPISKYLPAGTPTPRWGQDEIRLIDLATHTSGLPKMPTNLVSRDVSNLYADYSSDQLLAYLKHEARGNAGRSLLSAFTPAKQPSHNYSNVGIGLLGYLLSRAANIPYEQLLIEKVCDPLGLNDTRVELTEEQQARLAPGHSSRKTLAPNWDFDCLAPCAGLNSTCEDMLKYLSVFLDRQNGMVKSAELALQQHRPIDANNSVGLCWKIENGSEVAHHDGSTGGYHARVMLRQKSDVGVVILANSRNIVIEQLAPRMLLLAVGAPIEPIPIRKPAQVDPTSLSACVGDYRDNNSNTATVVQVEGGLIVRPNDAPEHDLYPETETEFFTKLSPSISFSFIKNIDGSVDEMIYRDGTVGLTMRYRRVSSK